MSEGVRVDDGPTVPQLLTVLPQAWRAAAERGVAAVALAGRLSPEPDPTVEQETRDVRVVWANAAAVDLLGLGPGELDDVPLLDAGPRQQRGQAWPRVVASLLRGTGGQETGVVRRPDESTRRVQVQVVPLQGGWLATLTPHVDDEKAARTAAIEADHRFRALAEHAPVGIFLSEAGLRLGYVNGTFAALLGTDPGALTGTAWIDAVHPDDRPELLEAIHTVLAGQQCDLRVRRAVPVATRTPQYPDAPDTTATAATAATPDVPDAPDAPGPAAGRGATRWLHLRLAPTTTPSRAAGFVGTAEDVTSRRAWEEQMSYQAHHDPLTGLVNRRRLVAVLAELFAGRRAHERAFGVLFFDLDGFKEVNDTYGHEAGDRVLIEVGQRLRRTARDQDVVARIAGDEFVVVLRQVAHPDEAEAAGQRQLAALAAPLTVAGRQVLLSASLGIAMPEPQDTPETLLRAADRVMYDAKAAGSGGYRLARPDTDPDTDPVVEPDHDPDDTEGDAP